ncbi:MAG: ABC transporter ATP-binding protein [Aigarchaeota archaeon]|nr:ABC transporter ATP-binding protein [Aigarchaeota archaeon]MCX8192996.1 ABC transporter ATP-binding protein [Nitrososphaeria archaeon]MDW7986268.1 ABC transporter ATP-binding protein [Nitrososphaerota archaeon]
MEELVHLHGIVKRFPGVIANDNVDFTLKRGEIHALLGENGAGKTTLMNILYGLYKPDSGEIYIEGRRVEIRSPKEAIKLGIGMVHQNFKLIPQHTVLENVILGLKDVGFIIDSKKIGEEIKKLAEQYNWKIDPHVFVWQLSAGEKQQVELLKILYRKAKILILDEPTSVLTPQECKYLFYALRMMVKEGRGVIFITHKLDEALAISDRVTVMRRGKVVATKNTWETDIKELASFMIGRPVLFNIEKNKTYSDEELVIVRNLKVFNDAGVLSLKNVNLTIRKNEIFGIIGVTGNGQQELAEVLAGLRRPVDGEIIIDGIKIVDPNPQKMIELGVAYIPPEPMKYGVAPNLSVIDNLFLKAYRYRPYSKKIFIDIKKMEKKAEEIVEKFNIVCPSPSIKVRSLSGGNIQRLILARELSELIGGVRSKLIIATYPTKGLDIAAAEFLNKSLIEYSKLGTSILYITEDIEEAMMVCDRIGVIHDGKIVGTFKPGEVSVEKIGLMMAGADASISS